MFICHDCRPPVCYPCNCACFLCSDAAANIHGDQGLQRPPSPDHSSSTVSSPVPHQVQFSSEMIAPQSPPPTWFTAKWGAVMSSHWSGSDQTSSRRKRLPRAVQSLLQVSEIEALVFSYMYQYVYTGIILLCYCNAQSFAKRNAMVIICVHVLYSVCCMWMCANFTHARLILFLVKMCGYNAN